MIDLEDFKERKKLHGFWKACYYTLTDLRIAKFFRHVSIFLAQLKAYLPIIWRDGDFDYSSLLTLMEFKLLRMSAHMIEHNLVMDAPRMSKELKVAALLCRRINNDSYAEIPLERLTKEYGQLEWNNEPTSNPRLLRLVLDRPKAREGTEAYEKVMEKQRKIFAQARIQRENDKKYLFSLMAKKLDHWWC